VDALTRRVLFLQTLVTAMLGQPLDPTSRAVLDKAVIATYTGHGKRTP
jgi:hypothetical protein